MLAQPELPYRARHIGCEAWARKLEVIRAAVNLLTAKNVADELDISGSALADALNERDNKRWAARWCSVLIVMLGQRGDEVALKLQGALLESDAELTPYRVEERQPLTPKELAAAYERELSRLGDVGREAMARARRGGK